MTTLFNLLEIKTIEYVIITSFRILCLLNDPKNPKLSKFETLIKQVTRLERKIKRYEQSTIKLLAIKDFGSIYRCNFLYPEDDNLPVITFEDTSKYDVGSPFLIAKCNTVKDAFILIECLNKYIDEGLPISHIEEMKLLDSDSSNPGAENNQILAFQFIHRDDH